MSDLTALTVKAVRKLMEVTGPVKQVAIAGMDPMRAITSESTSLINAVRGKTDNKRRYQMAVIKEEIPTPANLKPGATVTIAAEGFSGEVEEGDFIDDSGVITCFIS